MDAAAEADEEWAAIMQELQAKADHAGRMIARFEARRRRWAWLRRLFGARR